MACVFTFVGNTDPKRVAAMLVADSLVRADVTVIPRQRKKTHRKYNENLVLYATNSKFTKSDIYNANSTSKMTTSASFTTTTWVVA